MYLYGWSSGTVMVFHIPLIEANVGLHLGKAGFMYTCHLKVST